MFFVEYVVAVVLVQDLVKVDLAADADGLVVGVTAAVVEIVAIADVAFDNDYTLACVFFFFSMNIVHRNKYNKNVTITRCLKY